MNGKIARYFDEKNFGFIKVEGQPDHFFHRDACLNFVPEKGLDVQFESHETSKGMRAEQITA